MKYQTQATEKEKLLFKQQEQEIRLILNNEQLDYIISLCKNDIAMNEDLIKDLKNKTEKLVWRDEVRFAKKLIKRINGLRAEQEHTQLVIQSLTAEQEDYVIENQLEQIREAREYEI
jgi:hypothetical protein